VVTNSHDLTSAIIETRPKFDGDEFTLWL